MKTKTIAMWSGPRNLSTALMRSFAQRADCQVWDEPFYAAYLVQTGLDHPMRDEIIADGVSDPAQVIRRCTDKPGKPASLFFQKHMTHHMTPNIDLAWMDTVDHAFLIRAPNRVLASYARKRQSITPEDLGYAKQRELFERVCDKRGEAPAVIDSTDLRCAPRQMLEQLCNKIGIGFDPAMLDWKPGPAKEDGVWGRHWYANIWKSTCFAPPDKAAENLPGALQKIHEVVLKDYEFIKKHKI